MTDAIDLTPVMRRFVLHWGEMGARWGINRTVAQIHALLYIWPRPLTAEQIAGALSVARSNVSMSLKELQGWGIVRVTHVLGDRRDHYETTRDVWAMFQTILDERKRREIDPTVEVLRRCVDEASVDAGLAPAAGSTPDDVGAVGRGESEDTVRKLADLLELLETASGWYNQLRKLPAAKAMKVMRMGKKIRKMLAATP